MGGTPVKIGPFAGGLNTYSTATAVGDAEVVDIKNFDIDLDGSLYSRAPITNLDGPATGVTGNIVPLGWFIHTNGDRYLLCNVGTAGIYARNQETNVWTLVTSTIVAGAFVQYANKAWFASLPGSANPGGSWDPSAGFTAVAAIPKGTSATIYKERMFIGGSTTNPNRVYFSDAANFAVWQTSVNFFDVRSGDGQDVVKVLAYQDVVAIFKSDSTFLYSYDSAPSRGVVRLVNSSVGLTNKRCIVEYDTSLYLHYKDKIYQINNWNFTLVNMKVPFLYTVLYPSYSDNEPSLSLMADRLVVHHYDNIYVFNLRMGIWTKWHVNEERLFNHFVEVPRKTSSEVLRYFGGCRQTVGTQANRTLFEWRDGHDAGRIENIDTYVITKSYDFNVPHTFKRLFWWGADMLTSKDVNYTVHPVAYSPAVSHADLSAYAHQDITGSHLRPLSISLNVTGTSTISNISSYRMFIKFIKSLRFRQIYFTLGGSTNGTTTEGPIRIFSLLAFVDNKQTVSNKIS